MCTQPLQDVGNAIRAGDLRLARIDVSRPNFLARDNLPPVALPLPQILPKITAVPEEEIALLHLSLEEEIDKFHFEEEENPGVPLVTISDAEGEADRHSGVHTPILVIAGTLPRQLIRRRGRQYGIEQGQ